LGLAQGDDDELVASQGVTTRFFSTSDEHEMGRPAKIELLEPTNDDTPIGKFLAKRGQGIQQICFRVENIVGLLAHLQNHGIGLINESPIQGAHGSLVAFVHPKSTGGVLVELCQL
jgi:methylmalonyl-CoA/ethylmalonyl-CoA epimerase